MWCRNRDDALRQAYANAVAQSWPWRVFADTSGNWRAERLPDGFDITDCGYVLVYPNGTTEDVLPMTRPPTIDLTTGNRLAELP
jgi:hypothetical protein